MGTKTCVHLPAFIYPAALLLAFGGLVSCSGTKNGGGIKASGTIEAREVNVASRVSGQVREIKVDEGSRVKMGDVLVLIEHDMADIQLRQAEAGAELARAQLDLIRKGARGEDIKQGEEALKQADTNLKVAADDAKRMRELAAKGSVTLKQRDDAEARLIVAQAQQARPERLSGSSGRCQGPRKSGPPRRGSPRPRLRPTFLKRRFRTPR